MPKVIGFNPVDLGFGGMINYSGSNNNKVLADVKGGSYPKLFVHPDPYISGVVLFLQPTTSDTTIVDKSGTASITGSRRINEFL